MYWIRRAAVVGVALVVIIGLGTLLARCGDGADAASDRAKASSATPTASPTDTASLSGAENTDPEPESSPTKKAAKAQPSGPCDPAKISTTTQIKNKQAGKTVRIALRLFTTETACSFDVAAKNIRVALKKGNKVLWTTQDCPRAVEQEDVVLRAAGPVRVFVPWHGRESDGKCSGATPWVLPGDYTVVSAVLGGEPNSYDVTLKQPVAKTVTASPKPKKGDRSPSGAVVPEQKRNN